MSGALLALSSAITFALNNALFRRGAHTGSVMAAMMITVPLGAAFFIGVVAAAGLLPMLADMSQRTVAFFALAGLVHFVFGRYCNYRAIKAVGSVIAGPIVDSSIIWTILLALVVLGETLSITAAIGIAMIVAGPGLTMRRRRLPERTESGFEPKYGEGIGFGLLSGFFFGVSPVLISFAIDGNGDLAIGLLGGMISYCAAAAIVTPLILSSHQRRTAFEAGRGSMGWFLSAGLFISLSQMTRYMAFAVAPVSLVAPILRTSFLFRLLFAWLFNRRSEIITKDVVLVTIVCGLGVLLVAFGI